MERAFAGSQEKGAMEWSLLFYALSWVGEVISLSSSEQDPETLRFLPGFVEKQNDSA